MGLITFRIVSIGEIVQTTLDVITSVYGQVNDINSLREQLQFICKPLRKDLVVALESPYVDKVYRDSYYFYFATKHRFHHRDCVRLSFFEPPVTVEELNNFNEQQLQNHFVGYCVLRPIFHAILGRNLFSRTAFMQQNFISCLHEENVLINGIKLSIKGFSHSSQDQHTISCAETNVWALMEYFGHRYAEYKPVLPSGIISTLIQYSETRMLPSNGLTIEQISFALKSFGFGTLIYAKDVNKEDFRPALSAYVESGVPVIVTIGRDDEQTPHPFYHAILLIGKENVSPQKVAGLFSTQTGLAIIPFRDAVSQYVVQDDNLMPYSLTPLDQPGIRYGKKSEFFYCELKAFTVPLYPKIYMDATMADSLLQAIFADKQYGTKTRKPHVFRMYLASSRSFKQHLARQNKLPPAGRTALLSLTMPKLVWCGEFTNKFDAEKGWVSTLIVLDATEASENGYDSFIFAAHQKNTFVNTNLPGNPIATPSPPFEFVGFTPFYNLK